MNEERKNNNGRGIFYGVIGVATLVVAIIGATFAYFTATASDENTITGNAAVIDLGIAVTKVTTAGDNTGLIPMSNGMVETAINTSMGSTSICIDDNGNAVCQVYKVVITNDSSAVVFVDGYVALKGGSGTPADFVSGNTAPTTMRWAQAFCTETGGAATTCTTAGTVELGDGTASVTTDNVTFTSLDNTTEGHNKVNIRTEYATSGDAGAATSFVTSNGVTIPGNTTANKGAISEVTISGNKYAAIGYNYIRVSEHTFAAETLSAEEAYNQEDDVTSALVYNQMLYGNANPTPTTEKPNTRTYYFVVWLSENGANQTPGSGGENVAATENSFFQGQVKFMSAQGSEVSATFGGYTRSTAAKPSA